MTAQRHLGSLSKNKLFWILNIGGWLGISLLTYIYNQSELVSWFYFYVIYTYYLLGMVVTLALRRYYRSRLKRILSIPRLILFILYSALISALLIYFFHSIMCLPFYFQYLVLTLPQVFLMGTYEILFFPGVQCLLQELLVLLGTDICNGSLT